MMLSRTLSAAAAAILLTSTAAAAPAQQTANSPGNTVRTAPAPNLNQKVCVRGRFTGSNITRTECRTAREWIRTEGAVPTND